jgi:mRNA interferase MazF
MRFEFGDVVLVAFPFADGVTTKQRPAVVILDVGDDDVVVARVTSRTRATEYEISVANWKEAGLLGASTVRLHKLATIGKDRVHRVLGKLSRADAIAARNAWAALAAR